MTPDVVTGELWLEPGNISIPDDLREPYDLVGLDEGPPELDERLNPGAGRAPTVDGINARPELRLLSARVLDEWRSHGDDASAGGEGTPANGAPPPTGTPDVGGERTPANGAPTPTGTPSATATLTL